MPFSIQQENTAQKWFISKSFRVVHFLYTHVYSLRNELNFQILETGLNTYVSQEVYNLETQAFRAVKFAIVIAFKLVYKGL